MKNRAPGSTGHLSADERRRLRDERRRMRAEAERLSNTINQPAAPPAQRKPPVRRKVAATSVAKSDD